MLNRFTAKFDFEHPMYGIFHEARKRNFPIKQYVIIKNSSRYFETIWKPVDILIEESSDPYGWASEGIENSFVEFHFLLYQLNIEGYSLSYPSGDDEIPRNWELRCFLGDKNFSIDKRLDDKTLCPNTAPYTFCGYNDQKYFQLSKSHTCNSLQITQIGPNNNGRHYFGLLGFEVFGNLEIPQCISFQIKYICSNINIFYIYAFIIT